MFPVNLHYNKKNNFSFVNDTEMHQFKVTYQEIKPYPLQLGNMLKDFTIY